MSIERTWVQSLDERHQKELLFARVYAQGFSHGTDGHNRLLLINKMAELLDQAYGVKTDVSVDVEFAKEETE
jgi:hypothetical protein